MLSYTWPIALAVLSNVVYHLCSKSVPDEVSPFAALTVTYLIGALLSVVLFFTMGGRGSLLRQLSGMGWAPYVLGISIVGLEVGFMFAYKAGWQISMASIVQSAFLAIALLAVGYLVYHEPLTWNKLVGIVLCMAGLAFINLR